MKAFVAGLIFEAQRMLIRFMNDTPANFVEDTVFKAVREIAQRGIQILEKRLRKFRHRGLQFAW